MPLTRRKSVLEIEDTRNDKKKMTNEDEDDFITIILTYFDVIENKATDKSLDPTLLAKRQNAAWTEIRSKFIAKSGMVNILYGCRRFMFLYFWPYTI